MLKRKQEDPLVASLDFFYQSVQCSSRVAVSVFQELKYIEHVVK